MTARVWPRGLARAAAWRGALAAAVVAVGCAVLLVAMFADASLARRLAPWMVGALAAPAALWARRAARPGERAAAAGVGAAALTAAIGGTLMQLGSTAATGLAVLAAAAAGAAAVTAYVHRGGAAVGHAGNTRRIAAGVSVRSDGWVLAAAAVAAAVAAAAAVVGGRTTGVALAALLTAGGALIAWRMAAPRISTRALTAALAALAVAAAPFRQVSEIQVGGVAVGVSDALLAAALLLWLGGRGRRAGARVPVYAWAVLIFTAWLGLTSLAAAAPALALKEVLKWLQVAAGVALLADVMRGRRERRTVFVLVGASLLAQAVLGLVQTAAQLGPAGLVVGGVLRAYGTFDQPNPYGGYLALHLPVVLAAAVYARGSRRRWLLLLGLLMLAALLVSRSRGAWLGFGAGTLTVVLAAGARTAPAARAAMAALALGALALAGALLAGVFDGVLAPDIDQALGGAHPVADVVRARALDDFAVAQRVAHWAAGWRMLLDWPLLGVGAGNFDAAYRFYALPPFDEPLGHAHNVVLNFGAEAGLAGMLAFAGLSLWALWIAASAVRRSRGAALEWLPVGACGGLAAIVTQNMVDSLFVSGMGSIFALLVGACLAATPARRRAGAPAAQP